MHEYDVVVVGAGPGGSAAAYFLANAGARVALVEKKEFPRAKTCGDGLTPRSVKVLQEIGMGPDIQSYARARGLRVIGAKRTLELEWPHLSEFASIGLVRRRKDLDASIAERAVGAGATLNTKTEAVAPLIEGGRVAGIQWVRKAKASDGGVEKVDEGTIRAKFTLIADGASSSFGKRVGIAKKPEYPLGLAIRTYYRSDRSDDEFLESWLELKKDDELLPGYGWLFPMGDGTVNIGVGILNTFGRWREVNLAHLQRSFIEMLPASYGITHEDQAEPFQSGRLPMGGSVEQPYGPGYLVVGDAAGMVNPFNGEGIAYALETGKLAAGMITDVLRDESDLKLGTLYREALHDTYGSYYRFGRKFVRIIGKPWAFRALCQVGMRSQTIMEFVMQVLANLAEPKGGGLGDRGFRALMRLAEFELPELAEPKISVPSSSARVSKEVGAA